ncbi:MAG: methionine synthase [Halobacteriaceae archaeon]
MASPTDRITTTHIGSLPRSDIVLDLLKQKQRGEPVDDDTWTETLTDATESVLDRQLEVGLDSVNNGEQGRVSFNWYVADRITGIDGERPAPMWADLADFPGYAEDSFDTDVIDLTTQPAITGPVTYEGTDAATEELDIFLEALDARDRDPADAFITAASPGVIAATHDNEYYDDYETYIYAVADAIQTEYELVADTGVTLQIDAPALIAAGHRNFVDAPTEDWLAFAELHVDAINHALENVPSDQVRLHTCWGSYEGPHHLDRDLEAVLPVLYEADISALSVEQANPRHQHEYRAFAAEPLPADWTLIPGVVDVKTNIVDHPETIADRIERVAEAIEDPGRLVAAPDCGFGTQAGLGMVYPDIAWKKLEALTEGAAIATDRLF